MTLSYNLAYQQTILVHPTRCQIFAGKPYSTFWNTWDLLISKLSPSLLFICITYIVCQHIISIIISKFVALYLLLVNVSNLKKKRRKSRKWLYVIYASYKCEEAYYRLFLLEKLKRHFKNAAYIYLKGFTSSKRHSNESFNVIIL